jgi:hypothetical protein
MSLWISAAFKEQTSHGHFVPFFRGNIIYVPGRPGEHFSILGRFQKVQAVRE